MDSSVIGGSPSLSGSRFDPDSSPPLPLDKNKCIVAFVLPPGLAKLISSMLDPRAAAAGESPPLLDGLGWASLAAGSLVALITFFTSYSHVDLFGAFQFKVNQQIGIPLLLAAMAALFGEVKLASNDRCADQGARKREARAREREANEADRERHRAAEERERASRRHRIQARCVVAQCRFLLSDTPRNRLQLNEALALLMEEIRPSEA
jgi:hypothetical protein